MSSDWSKIFTTNLPNFTEFHRRKRKKIHCQFSFLCSCWHQKISKNTDIFLRVHADYLSFRPQHVCDSKTIGSHLKSTTPDQPFEGLKIFFTTYMYECNNHNTGEKIFVTQIMCDFYCVTQYSQLSRRSGLSETLDDHVSGCYKLGEHSFVLDYGQSFMAYRYYAFTGIIMV